MLINVSYLLTTVFLKTAKSNNSNFNCHLLRMTFSSTCYSVYHNWYKFATLPSVVFPPPAVSLICNMTCLLSLLDTVLAKKQCIENENDPCWSSHAYCFECYIYILSTYEFQRQPLNLFSWKVHISCNRFIGWWMMPINMLKLLE